MFNRSHSRVDGQIMVLFALMLVAVVAMVGLVLDGGDTFAQRRGQQNAADLAALAGANAQIFQQDATTAAKVVTELNGYKDGANGVTVLVTFPASNQVQVDISAPHENSFAGVVPGQSTWQVSVTATAEQGVPTGNVTGAAPIIFSQLIFDPFTGLPNEPYGCEEADRPCNPPAEFGDGNGDVPNNPGDVAWTLYGSQNVNTNDVRPYLAGTQVLTVNFAVGDYIGQSNGGFHTSIFGSGTGVADPSACDGSSSHTNVDTCLSGKDVVVPIVSPLGSGLCNDQQHNGGCFEGWALFHVVSADGGSVKSIQGYFVSGFASGVDGLCDFVNDPNCAGYFHGLYGLKLIN